MFFGGHDHLKAENFTIRTILGNKTVKKQYFKIQFMMQHWKLLVLNASIKTLPLFEKLSHPLEKFVRRVVFSDRPIRKMWLAATLPRLHWVSQAQALPAKMRCSGVPSK